MLEHLRKYLTLAEAVRADLSQIALPLPTTETFNAHDYTVRVLQQSRIDPVVWHEIDTAIICPRCKAHLPLLDHGGHQKCGDCGLYMELWGNALKCTV